MLLGPFLREKPMASNKKFDLALWDERVYIASDQLRLAVEELSALCSARGVDLDAQWCRSLVCAVVQGYQAFQYCEEYFEARMDAERPEAGSEPPSALYVKSH
jgi:hypothetical protein